MGITVERCYSTTVSQWHHRGQVCTWRRGLRPEGYKKPHVTDTAMASFPSFTEEGSVCLPEHLNGLEVHQGTWWKGRLTSEASTHKLPPGLLDPHSGCPKGLQSHAGGAELQNQWNSPSGLLCVALTRETSAPLSAGETRVSPWVTGITQLSSHPAVTPDSQHCETTFQQQETRTQRRYQWVRAWSKEPREEVCSQKLRQKDTSGLLDMTDNLYILLLTLRIYT